MREKGFAHILILVLLLAGIGLGTYLVGQKQLFKPKAAGSNCSPGQTEFYDKCINVLKIFGQKNFTETSRDTVTGNKIYHASGITIDKNSSPNKFYVVDSGNNRILGFNGMDEAGTKNADIIFGQPDSASASCNRDNNLGIYKNTDADSLCFLPYPAATNTAEAWTRTNIDVDSEGNLYVVDTFNNRVLKYSQPFSPDKTNGKGDNTADSVWGQDNFQNNKPNKGSSSPNNSSISTDLIANGASSRGVSADNQQNVWVADTDNHRVLRFPSTSKTANLVIGQTDFTTNDSSGCVGITQAPKNKLCKPTLARVNSQTGELYVLDENPGNYAFASRILVFKAPFTNGMTASRVITPKINGVDLGGKVININMDYSFNASGFIFNPYKQGGYANGDIWVNENPLTKRALLLDKNGNVLEVIGSIKDPLSYQGCDFRFYVYGTDGPTQIFNNYQLCWPGGSIGVDSNNNLYFADEAFHRISRFALPVQYRQLNFHPGQSNGVSGLISEPNGGFLPGTDANRISPEKFSESVGTFTFGNKLIVKDRGRFLVWNNYTNQTQGTAADLIVGQTAGNVRNDNSIAERAFHTIDDKNRLWTFNKFGKIAVYQLPFTQGSAPLVDSIKLYWNDTKDEVNYNGYGSIAFDKINKKIYVNDGRNNRILRVSNYDEFNNKLYVDAVIGQPDKNHTKCNNDQNGGWLAPGAPRANTLCENYQLQFDKFSNLYVVENNYECHGNDRITVFMADDLQKINPAINQTLFPQTNARKVFIRKSLNETPLSCANDPRGPTSPVSIAFNSKNQMVIGNDGYYPGNQRERHLKQLWFYNNPLKKNSDGSFVMGQLPDAYITVPMGAPGEIDFDDQDNLIVQDHTWYRTWLINLDKDPSWLVYINGSIPSTPNPIATATPTPIPYYNLTPTPKPTATTPKLTATPTPVSNEAPGCTPCRADVNKNGVIDESDKSLTLNCVGKSPGSYSQDGILCARADTNGSGGIIDWSDYYCTQNMVGQVCALSSNPTPTPTPIPWNPIPTATPTKIFTPTPTKTYLPIPTPTPTTAKTITPIPTVAQSSFKCTACLVTHNQRRTVNIIDYYKGIYCNGKTIYDSTFLGSCASADLNGDKKINAMEADCIRQKFNQTCYP